MFYLWIRRQVRKVMEPLPLEKAQFYSSLFTNAYVLTGWAIFGTVVYIFYGAKKNNPRLWNAIEEDQKINPGVFYGRAFQAENMKIYAMQGFGFSIVKEGEYKYSEDIDLQQQTDKEAVEFYGDESMPSK